MIKAVFLNLKEICSVCYSYKFHELKAKRKKEKKRQMIILLSQWIHYSSCPL